jgi:hypothetical protein
MEGGILCPWAQQTAPQTDSVSSVSLGQEQGQIVTANRKAHDLL